MKFYIATGLDNWEFHNIIRDQMRARGFKITYDWTTHKSVAHKGQQVCQTTAVKELEGVAKADIVVVLLPGGRGTHIEIGIALAFNRRVIIYGTPEDFAFEKHKTCVFYYHPNVKRITGRRSELFWDICATRGVLEKCQI